MANHIFGGMNFYIDQEPDIEIAPNIETGTLA